MFNLQSNPDGLAVMSSANPSDIEFQYFERLLLQNDMYYTKTGRHIIFDSSLIDDIFKIISNDPKYKLTRTNLN